MWKSEAKIHSSFSIQEALKIFIPNQAVELSLDFDDDNELVGDLCSF